MKSFTKAAIVIVFLTTVRPPDRLSAQGVLNQFSYDSLKLWGIQADLGVLGASRLRGTVVGGVRLDYGRIAPRIRVLLGVSYFKGEFDRNATNQLAQRLRAIVNDPDSNFVIDVGRIMWSDLTTDVDLQYVLPQGHTVTAYLGTGLSLHGSPTLLLRNTLLAHNAGGNCGAPLAGILLTSLSSDHSCVLLNGHDGVDPVLKAAATALG